MFIYSTLLVTRVNLQLLQSPLAGRPSSMVDAARERRL